MVKVTSQTEEGGEKGGICNCLKSGSFQKRGLKTTVLIKRKKEEKRYTRFCHFIHHQLRKW